MNKATELNEQEVLKIELQVLKQEHRDLDDAITALLDKAGSDALTIQRLKKKKLVLKDKIARIEDKLLPDIIA